jgi:hypothetical protein
VYNVAVSALANQYARSHPGVAKGSQLNPFQSAASLANVSRSVRSDQRIPTFFVEELPGRISSTISVAPETLATPETQHDDGPHDAFDRLDVPVGPVTTRQEEPPFTEESRTAFFSLTAVATHHESWQPIDLTSTGPAGSFSRDQTEPPSALRSANENSTAPVTARQSFAVGHASPAIHETSRASLAVSQAYVDVVHVPPPLSVLKA